MACPAVLLKLRRLLALVSDIYQGYRYPKGFTNSCLTLSHLGRASFFRPTPSLPVGIDGLGPPVHGCLSGRRADCADGIGRFVQRTFLVHVLAFYLASILLFYVA